MRQKLFWFDLAVCSLWMLITLANCSWWSLSIHLLMVVMVVMRIILSLSLYLRKKRSWLPLVVFSALLPADVGCYLCAAFRTRHG